MPTIPASNIVAVTPNVLNAGGNALVLNGLVLTASSRVPIGSVKSFISAPAVAAFFGLASHEALIANVYFGGFDNSNVKPGAILFSQFTADAVSAFLQGANISALPLAQLQGLTGSLNVVVDGVARNAASINLAPANSFSAAAGIIQTALNATPIQTASVTGSIGQQVATFTGSIAGNLLTVTGTSGGIPIVPGAVLGGTGVSANTVVQNQLSGVTGSVGTYAVSVMQTCAGTAMTGVYGLLNVTAINSGSLAVGQTLAGSGVTASTQITALGSGQGLTGTYYVTPGQTVGAVAMTTAPTPVTVSFDSVSGGFIINSGVLGASSSMAFATGTLAVPLLLTSANGATLSQGSAGMTAAAAMTAVVNASQNWATFMLAFDPDDGSGNTQKLAFAQWASQQNNRYAYIARDLDASPAAVVPANSSLGQLIAANTYSGTALVWEPSDMLLDAFLCGAIASIDFTETNGRTTIAFRSQSGLLASVTDATTAANLRANGYNFLGAYATAAQTFVFMYPGTISGPFQWIDSYVNQIWLNASFQQDLIELLTQVKSIPYNAAGASLIEAALADTIQAGLNFGAFRPGVTLSQAQIAEVNSAAGVNIAQTLGVRGWYLQVRDASPQVRQARASPPCTFWYMDGESVQQINLASVLLQ